MPTTAELASMSYTGASAFAKGFTAEDFRREIEEYGEACQFYKAIPVYTPRSVSAAEENGKVYVLQTLASGVQIYVYEARKEEQGGEFGILPVGTTMITTMPDEIWPVRGDRFVLTERVDRARVLVTRDSDTTDTIPHSPLVSVIEVRNGATLYTPTTHYTVSGQVITWVGATKPTSGTKYSVELSYRPTYEYLPLSERMPRVGADGLYLPLRGLLTRVQLTGEAV